MSKTLFFTSLSIVLISLVLGCSKTDSGLSGIIEIAEAALYSLFLVQ